MSISTRIIKETDAPIITQLSGQLGYSITEEQTLKNIKTILEHKDHDAFVAEDDGQVIGWIGVMQSITLESYPHCEVKGLVIDDAYRHKGIGKLLLEKAKEWGRSRGNSKLRLRCNAKRLETHLFYEHLGFKETKMQKQYEIGI